MEKSSTPSAIRPLVILDCDSTTIQDEVIELLADAAGTREEVARVTEAAMRGELDFAESLAARVATLAGTSESVFADALSKVRPSPGISDLVAAVHERDGIICVVSGGFHEVLDPLAERLGIDRWRANRLEVVDGKLTGKTVGPIIDANAKVAALKEWAQDAGIPLEHTIAAGDGANDLGMLAAAQIGVAYKAKPIVREKADEIVDDSLASIIPLLDRL